ncbi:MAG: phage tail protein [Paracoccaceae bacterium]|nr:phage tail protein [Paracoccaceae bacterium]
MAAAAGRAIRIAFDADGAGAGAAIAIVGSTKDNFEITKEGINVTDKDDAGVQTFIDDVVGTWAMSGGVDGFLKDTTILALMNDTSQFTHTMEVAVAGLGTYRGLFAITNFKVDGPEGAEAATFSFQITSSGTITFT